MPAFARGRAKEHAGARVVPYPPLARRSRRHLPRGCFGLPGGRRRRNHPRMSPSQVTIVVLLTVMMVMFIWGKWRHDMVAMGALLA